MRLTPRFTFSYHCILITALCPLLAHATLLRPDNTDTLFQQQTQQQQAQQQQFDAKAPDVNLSAPLIKTSLKFPDENPCFAIEKVDVNGQEALPHWVPGAAPGETQIVINRQQSRFWRVSAWVDNSGGGKPRWRDAGVR